MSFSRTIEQVANQVTDEALKTVLLSMLGECDNNATLTVEESVHSPCAPIGPATIIKNFEVYEETFAGTLEGCRGADFTSRDELYLGDLADQWFEAYPEASKLSDLASVAAKLTTSACLIANQAQAIGEYQAELAEAKREMEQYQIEANKDAATIADLKAAATGHLIVITDLKAEVNALECNLEFGQGAELKKAQAEVVDLTRRVAVLQERLSGPRGGITVLEDEVADLQGKLNTETTESEVMYKGMRDEIADLKAEAGRMATRLNKKDVQIAKLNEAADEGARLVRESADELLVATMESAAVKSELKRIGSEIIASSEAYNEEIDALKSDADIAAIQNRQSRTVLGEKVCRLESQLADYVVTADRRLKRLKASSSDIALLEGQVEGLESDARCRDSVINGLKEDAVKAEKTIKTRGERIDELMATVSALKVEVADYNSNPVRPYRELTEEIAELKTAEAVRGKALYDARAEIADLKEQVKGLQKVVLVAGETSLEDEAELADLKAFKANVEKVWDHQINGTPLDI